VSPFRIRLSRYFASMARPNNRDKTDNPDREAHHEPACHLAFRNSRVALDGLFQRSAYRKNNPHFHLAATESCVRRPSFAQHLRCIWEEEENAEVRMQKRKRGARHAVGRSQRRPRILRCAISAAPLPERERGSQESTRTQNMQNKPTAVWVKWTVGRSDLQLHSRISS
jgi:hypothetical protein